MSINKKKADDYVEIVFDDILERSDNAALWLHATSDGDACIYVTKGEDTHRGTLQRSLVAAMLDDPDLLEDFAVAVAHALTIRSKDEGGGLSWPPEYPEI